MHAVSTNQIADILNFNDSRYRISKRLASNKHRPLISTAPLGIHIEMSTSL